MEQLKSTSGGMRRIAVEDIKYVAIDDVLKEIDYMYSREGNADAVNLAVCLSKELKED